MNDGSTARATLRIAGAPVATDDVQLSQERRWIVAARRGRLGLAWIAPLALFNGIAVWRWRQFGDFVTGLDEGNWLAIGREYVDRRSLLIDDPYPPLVPLLLHAVQGVSDPIHAAKLVGVASLLAILLSAFVLARTQLNDWFALCIATTVGLSSVIAEQMVVGGYPQNVAFAFLAFAALSTARYLERRGRGSLIGVGVGLAGTALSHHAYFVLACLVMLLVWALWLTTRPGRGEIVASTTRLACAGALALAFFVPTYFAMRADGFDPAINAANVSLGDALRYGMRESPWMWFFALIAGGCFLIAAYPRRRLPIWQVATALMASSAFLLVMTAQARLMPPLVLGATLGLGLALQDVWSRYRNEVWGALPLVVIAAIPLILLLSPRSSATAAGLYERYSIVDQSLLNVANFVDHHHAGNRVVVRQDRVGQPLGWWFEGLTNAEILVGSDQNLLAFPDERDDAELVDRFFAEGMPGEDINQLAAQHGVDLIVLRKWEWSNWIKWLEGSRPAVRVVYDDGTYMAIAPAHSTVVR